MESQKVVVNRLLVLVLSNRGVEYELNGETPIKEVLTSTDISWVNEQVEQMFYDGLISLTDESRIKYIDSGERKLFTNYVKGMVKNWIKKEKTFNGGSGYVPKTKRGPSDSMLKQMKELRLQYLENPEVLLEIDREIEKRTLELKPKSIIINPELLPDSLKYLVD